MYVVINLIIPNFLFSFQCLFIAIVQTMQITFLNELYLFKTFWDGKFVDYCFYFCKKVVKVQDQFIWQKKSKVTLLKVKNTTLKIG